MKNLIIFILSIFISWPIASLAIQTNVNEVTKLFDKHIEGKQELLQNLEEQNNNAINQIKSGSFVDSIEGIGDAQSKASELGSIKETELDNAGRSRRASEEYKFYDENELEPDYTKPGHRLHKEDSDDIVSSTDDIMHKIGSNFMAKLNSEGFDCKTVKGSVVKEPTYYIEVKREEQKNTEYDQFFCEELRNQYRCHDSVSLTCKKKGMKWEKWEDRTIELSGSWIHWNHRWWTYAVKWKKKRFGIHLHPSTTSSHVARAIRTHIIETLGASDEQIHPVVNVPARGEGAINHIEGKGYIWERFRISYQYRDGTEICEQWSEDWTERCNLNLVAKPTSTQSGQRGK